MGVKVQKRARQIMARASFADDLAGQGLGSGAEDSEVWDPLTLSAAASEGQLLYLREAELKHGRICMLASLGAVVAEKFHPFFGCESSLQLAPWRPFPSDDGMGQKAKV